MNLTPSQPYYIDRKLHYSPHLINSKHNHSRKQLFYTNNQVSHGKRYYHTTNVSPTGHLLRAQKSTAVSELKIALKKMTQLRKQKDERQLSENHYRTKETKQNHREVIEHNKESNLSKNKLIYQLLKHRCEKKENCKLCREEIIIKTPTNSKREQKRLSKVNIQKLFDKSFISKRFIAEAHKRHNNSSNNILFSIGEQGDLANRNLKSNQERFSRSTLPHFNLYRTSSRQIRTKPVRNLSQNQYQRQTVKQTIMPFRIQQIQDQQKEQPQINNNCRTPSTKKQRVRGHLNLSRTQQGFRNQSHSIISKNRNQSSLSELRQRFVQINKDNSNEKPHRKQPKKSIANRKRSQLRLNSEKIKKQRRQSTFKVQRLKESYNRRRGKYLTPKPIVQTSQQQISHLSQRSSHGQEDSSRYRINASRKDLIRTNLWNEDQKVRSIYELMLSRKRIQMQMQDQPITNKKYTLKLGKQQKSDTSNQIKTRKSQQVKKVSALKSKLLLLASHQRKEDQLASDTMMKSDQSSIQKISVTSQSSSQSGCHQSATKNKRGRKGRFMTRYQQQKTIYEAAKDKILSQSEIQEGRLCITQFIPHQRLSGNESEKSFLNRSDRHIKNENKQCFSQEKFTDLKQKLNLLTGKTKKQQIQQMGRKLSALQLKSWKQQMCGFLQQNSYYQTNSFNIYKFYKYLQENIETSQKKIHRIMEKIPKECDKQNEEIMGLVCQVEEFIRVQLSEPTCHQVLQARGKLHFRYDQTYRVSNLQYLQLNEQTHQLQQGRTLLQKGIDSQQQTPSHIILF